MQLVASRFLRGPNIHLQWPCVEAVLDLQTLEGVSSTQLGGFADRLLALLPTLQQHGAAPGRPGGFADRLRAGIDLAHAVERAALELQCLAGSGVSFGRTQAVRGMPGHYRVVVTYNVEAVAALALSTAVDAVAALAGGDAFNLQQPLAALRALAVAHAIDAAGRAVIDTALQRGIPVLRLSEDERRFQLGWGSRQRRLELAAATTDGPSTAGTRGGTTAAASAIVDALFGSPGSGNDGRIPLVAITGTNGKTTTTWLVSHALQLAGRRTGTTTTQGVFIGGRTLDEGDCTGYWSARAVLESPDVDAAVLETARGGILKRGLAFDACDVGVVLNVAADHLGLDGIDTLADLARVKGLVARTARSAAVLNADDAHCVAMARQLRRGCIPVFFSMSRSNPVLQAHLRQGGRGACFDEHDGDGGSASVGDVGSASVAAAGGGWVLLWPGDGAPPQRLLRAALMPVAMGGHARYNIANALAAAAALMCAGLDLPAIAAGLLGFVSDVRRNPLRANRFDVGGVALIVDYAHNVAAYTALTATARSMLTQGRRQSGAGESDGEKGAEGGGARLIGVVTAPGDRRTADLFEIGRTCGAGFDALIVYEQNPRGRAAGETIDAILAGARAASAAAALYAQPSITAALAQGLRLAKSGDTVVFTCAGTLDDLVAGVRAVDAAAADTIAQQMGR